VNILDENIPKRQRLLLESQRIKVKQIGYNIGMVGMQDEEIIPLLLALHRPTFFTRDEDFYRLRLRHARYCLVYLDVTRNEVAFFVRRLLSQAAFKTQARRMGLLIRVSGAGVHLWRLHAQAAEYLTWE
jgi:hypothetical protein